MGSVQDLVGQTFKGAQHRCSGDLTYRGWLGHGLRPNVRSALVKGTLNILPPRNDSIRTPPKSFDCQGRSSSHFLGTATSFSQWEDTVQQNCRMSLSQISGGSILDILTPLHLSQAVHFCRAGRWRPWTAPSGWPSGARAPPRWPSRRSPATPPPRSISGSYGPAHDVVVIGRRRPAGGDGRYTRSPSYVASASRSSEGTGSEAGGGGVGGSAGPGSSSVKRQPPPGVSSRSSRAPTTSASWRHR